MERRRRNANKQKLNSTPSGPQVTSNLADKIVMVHCLMDRRKYAEAEQLLDQLRDRYRHHPAVVELEMCFYQETEDHERCCLAAKRMLGLTPRDPDALLLYAQESMFCGRLGIALDGYRQFLQRWPDHPNAEKAKNALELLEPECEQKAQEMGFGRTGLDLVILHEEVLEYVQKNAFKDAIRKCLELLERRPDCISARNNLALSYFHSGQVTLALETAEETYRLAPENRFAEAALGKLEFLGGNQVEADAIADRIVVNPSTEQDPLGALLELLGLLGRDEDIMVLSAAVPDEAYLDPRTQAMIFHYQAVARYRLGDEKSARSAWKKCLQAMPAYPEALENLDDLNSGQGHAAWYEPISKWVPKAVFDQMFGRELRSGKKLRLNLAQNNPAVAALIPAIFDRGDPWGREMALRLAAADGSPSMLEALRGFAFSSRGPDAMRYEALSILKQEGRVGGGPHRFFSRGDWTEIKLFSPKIVWETQSRSHPEVQRLLDAGVEAMHDGDYQLAEESFNRVLEIDPDDCTAAHNLCVIWMHRDGKAGRRRTKARLEELHAQFPDYRFASITLSHLAAMDGELERARELLLPIYDAEELNASEAAAFFSAEIRIALKRRDFDLAERTWETVEELFGEDDPQVVALRRLIDSATGRRGIWGKLSSMLG